jgi:ketosteroid isomerase-like protein
MLPGTSNVPVVTPEEELWASVNAIYAGFVAGDRDAIDANISPDATIWDSSHEPLLRGKADLDAVRDARPADAPRPELEAVDPVIDVFGDIGLVRHVLLVHLPGHTERIRNTSVWRRIDGGWLCIHNHEDLVS